MSEHEKTYSDDVTRDFIDVYLKEMRQQADAVGSSSSFHGNNSLFTTLVKLLKKVDLFLK